MLWEDGEGAGLKEALVPGQESRPELMNFQVVTRDDDVI